MVQWHWNWERLVIICPLLNRPASQLALIIPVSGIGTLMYFGGNIFYTANTRTRGTHASIASNADWDHDDGTSLVIIPSRFRSLH